MHKLIIIGGAKGVGKTSLTSTLATECGLIRIESGKLIIEYRAMNPQPPFSLKDYIANSIAQIRQDSILDAHFAQYSEIEELTREFQRGLEPEHIIKLSQQFDIYPCLVEVPYYELLQRRMKEPKKRSIETEIIIEELEFNRKAYQMYLKELNKKPIIITNDDFDQTKSILLKWIRPILDS